jgi:phosphoribosylglycinamide formyltransferase-1
MKKIAIFASGAGSNAAKIIEQASPPAPLLPEREGQTPAFQVALIVSNKPNAGITNIAEQNSIPTLIIDKEKFFDGDGYVAELKEKEIDLIVLAGFLWKIPNSLVEAFPQRIINIHPALLPKYGGKGMYGRFVHQAVIDNKERESGITIHYVDGHYDNGDVIFQATCPVLENDTADSLAKRVQVLEHQHYVEVIRKLVE